MNGGNEQLRHQSGMPTSEDLQIEDAARRAWEDYRMTSEGLLPGDEPILDRLMVPEPTEKVAQNRIPEKGDIFVK